MLSIKEFKNLFFKILKEHGWASGNKSNPNMRTTKYVNFSLDTRSGNIFKVEFVEHGQTKVFKNEEDMKQKIINWLEMKEDSYAN